jgi:hypothetical protein
MELALFVYLASLSDNLVGVGVLGACLLTVVLGIRYIHWACENMGRDDKRPDVKSNIRGIIACVFLAVFTPTKSTMYLMAGAYVGQEVATSEATNKFLDKTMRIIDKELDKLLEVTEDNGE